MSLLDNLNKRKNKLKHVETIVTHLDGRKFLETDQISTELTRNEYGFVIDTKPDNIPAKIIDNIYLGSQDCCDRKILNDYQIGHVLSIGIEPPIKYDNITYKFVQCLDLPETNLINIIKTDCIDFLNNVIQLKGNVLVHCNAGVSRSASVIIGYLILVYNYSYLDAYNIVKNARNCIRPNIGFEKQLKQLC